MLNRSMELGDLDARATLARAEREVSARRRQGVERLRLLQHWADLHSADPLARPGAVPLSRGGDRLVELGGEGTPKASELCWAELAIALETGVVALRNQAGQALDLRHRLPLLWALVQELRVEPWVAQKVAAMTRELTGDQAALVDTALAAAADESAGRMLGIAEAKTIEADPDGYRARLAEDERRTGVWVSRPKPGDLVDLVHGEPGSRRISAKLPAADVVEGEANIDDLADALAEHGEVDPDNPPTRGELRAQAFTLLVTDPHAAAALLDGLHTAPSTEEPVAVRPTRKRRPAVINVHLTDLVLSGQVEGITRVEALGPMLLEQVADLVRHRTITLQPVIDLNTAHSVNGYDHPTPYDPGGPPGQTGDHNDAPLTRFHHRAKTHDGYTVDQLGLGAYRWVTRHGLARIVTPRGTRKDRTHPQQQRHHRRRDLPRPRRGLPPADLICGAATSRGACAG